MKKVLVLSTSPIKHDGLSKIIYEILKYNRKYFLFELAAPENVENDEFDGIKRYELPTKNRLIRYLFEIKKLVKTNEYDVVYIHGNSALMFFETFISKIYSKSKIVTHCHSSSSEHRIAHFLVKPIFNVLPDMKIGCSNTASKWAYIGNNVATIPNGIEVNKFLFNEFYRAKTRESLGIKNKELLIGNIGRLTRQKNQLFLLEILKEFEFIRKDYKTIIIGEGELKQEIRQKIKEYNLSEKVILVPPSNDVEKYYSAIDVMVMPSLFEGMSLVALETQTNSLPCVSSEEFAKDSIVTDYLKIESLKSSPAIWARDIDYCYKNIDRGSINNAINNNKNIQIEEMMKRIHDILESV